MKRPTTIGAVVLAVTMLVSQMAAADPASQPTSSELTHKQVLHIALIEAKNSKDPHPKRIEVAGGSLGRASSVMDPTAEMGSGIEGNVAVDLVVMHGYFHIIGSPPRGDHIAPGKVMELIIDAHTGFVRARSLGNDVPVPLSQLGQVTRLL